MPQPKRSLMKKLAHGIVVLLGIFFAVELVFRVFDTVTAPSVNVHTNASVKYPPKRFAPFLVTDNIPSFRNDAVTTDANGFRSTPIDRDKPEGVFRIFLLGGSTAAGYGAPSNEATIAGRLETLLKERFPERRFEVANAAVASHMTTQELIMLHSRVLAFSPDLVVWLHGRNDFTYATYPQWEPNYSYRVSLVEDQVETVFEPWKQSLLDQSAVIQRTRIAWDRVFGSGEDRFGTDGAPLDGTFKPRAVDQYVENVLSMDAVCRARGIRTLFMLQPSLTATTKPLTPTEQEKLSQLAEKPGVFVRNYADLMRQYYAATLARYPELEARGIDVLDCSDPFAGEEREIFTDEVHINTAGNEVVAEAWLECMIERDLLSERD